MEETTAEIVSEAAADAVSEIVEAAVAADNQSAALAEEIARAALESERGHEIQELRREIDRCNSTMTELPALLAEQTRLSMEAMRADVMTEVMQALANVAGAGLQNHPVEVVEAPPASTLPVSAVEPEAMTPPPPESVSESKPAKPKRRFL
jgi:hypothetical protein